MTLDRALGERLCKLYEKVKGDRSTFDAHCNEIAEVMWPAYSQQFIGTPGTKGDKRTSKQFDARAESALKKYMAIMESLLTPAGSKWHYLKPSDRALLKDRDTRVWFDDVNTILISRRNAHSANFQGSQQQKYMSVGAFGNGVKFIDKPEGAFGLRYKAISLAETYFIENHAGIVDTCVRCFKLSARQARQKYGEDNLPDDIKQALKQDPEKEFEFIHVVMPREDFDPYRLDAKGKRFGSYTMAKAKKWMVAEGGFNSFPYCIGREPRAPGEIYGRSPAMTALPSVKVLNEQKKTVLKQGHRAVDPVILAADDGVLDTFDLKPGAVNYGAMSSEGKRLVDTLPTGNLAAGFEMMEMERADIDRAFSVDLFQILMDSPVMTATQALEIAREKGMLLAPQFGQFQASMLGPQLERELDVLSEQRLLPPMPQALLEARGEYEIVFDSPVNRMQKAEEGSGLMRTIEMTLNVVNVTQDPEPLDHFDWDVIVPEIAEQQAVPQRWMRDPKLVEKIRASRQEAQDTQTAIQAGPSMAAMMKAKPEAAPAK
jgi:hypothetical protein